MARVAESRERDAQRQMSEALSQELAGQRTLAEHEKAMAQARAMTSLDDVDDLLRCYQHALRGETERRAHESTLVNLRRLVDERRAAVVATMRARHIARNVADQAARALELERDRKVQRALDDASQRSNRPREVQ